MMESLFNEYCAEDISRNQKDSVRYRHLSGITVGRVPFGTIRAKKNGKVRQPALTINFNL
jgi:hypothetical protein